MKSNKAERANEIINTVNAAYREMGLPEDENAYEFFFNHLEPADVCCLKIIRNLPFFDTIAENLHKIPEKDEFETDAWDIFKTLLKYHENNLAAIEKLIEYFPYLNKVKSGIGPEYCICEQSCENNHNFCDDAECLYCGVRDCPHHEPLHYHHDGCAACLQNEDDE